jgi:hypothetical protein
LDGIRNLFEFRPGVPFHSHQNIIDRRW